MAALMQRKLDCRNWRLVLTGHSLGAGAAALIALHLKGRFASASCSAMNKSLILGQSCTWPKCRPISRDGPNVGPNRLWIHVRPNHGPAMAQNSI